MCTFSDICFDRHNNIQNYFGILVVINSYKYTVYQSMRRREHSHPNLFVQLYFTSLVLIICTTTRSSLLSHLTRNSHWFCTLYRQGAPSTHILFNTKNMWLFCSRNDWILCLFLVRHSYIQRRQGRLSHVGVKSTASFPSRQRYSVCIHWQQRSVVLKVLLPGGLLGY